MTSPVVVVATKRWQSAVQGVTLDWVDSRDVTLTLWLRGLKVELVELQRPRSGPGGRRPNLIISLSTIAIGTHRLDHSATFSQSR